MTEANKAGREPRMTAEARVGQEQREVQIYSRGGCYLERVVGVQNAIRIAEEHAAAELEAELERLRREDLRAPWMGDIRCGYSLYPLARPLAFEPRGKGEPFGVHVLCLRIQYGQSPWQAAEARIYAEHERAEKLGLEVMRLRALLGKERSQ